MTVPSPAIEAGPVQAILGDSREVLRGLADNSIDSCVCDPPYALTSIVKRFGKDGAAPAKSNGATGVYKRASSGFMGAKWDVGDTAFDPAFWAEVLRVLKPGAHVLACGGTRTYHRLAVAIEEAGFDVRDAVLWHYGQGFPKSHNISEGLKDASCTCEGETRSETDLQRVLRPVRRADVSATEHVSDEQGEVLLAGVPEQGSSTAVLRGEPGEGPRGSAEYVVEGRCDAQEAQGQLHGRAVCAGRGVGEADGEGGWLHHGAPDGDGPDVRLSAHANGSGEPHRPRPIEQSPEQSGALADERRSQARGSWALCGRCRKPMVPEGLGTALKPATEIIVLARKPLSESTVAANVLRWGTGALNIDGCRVGTTDSTSRPAGTMADGAFFRQDVGHREIVTTSGGSPLGRWPANLIHDGSDEVLAGFPETGGGAFSTGASRQERAGRAQYGDMAQSHIGIDNFGDSGTAARFFYCAKADSADRMASKHPTVKPVDLMAYLVRLVTRKGGTVLDPFAGSGTTGEAAMREGCKAILIEREPTYYADIQNRMKLALAGPEERARAIVKASGKLEPADSLPLFGGEQ